jgi:hypothetical protein
MWGAQYKHKLLCIRQPICSSFASLYQATYPE